MMVTQLINNKGNAAANQLVINSDKGRYFQSYNSIIALRANDGSVTFSSYWDYSNTTLKHLKIFLGVSKSKKELLADIESGKIKLVDELTVE